MALFASQLQQQGYFDPLEFVVCVVGSRKLLKESTSNPWSVLAPHLTIFGFDADPEACELANAEIQAQQLNYTEIHIPQAISGVVGETTLYVTKAVHCSSLYPPNTPFVSRLRGYCQGLELDFSLEMETETLDHWAAQQNINSVDVLQIDVQGADLEVLRGAENLLANVLAVEVEVEFSPLYQNQPLFADIDTFLRQLGFSLFDLSMNDPWCRQIRNSSPICSNQRPGQLLWADALYLRDLVAVDSSSQPLRTPTNLMKLAGIADALELTDYAFEVLETLTLEYGNVEPYNMADLIQSALMQFSGSEESLILDLPQLQMLKPYLKSSNIQSNS